MKITVIPLCLLLSLVLTACGSGDAKTETSLKGNDLTPSGEIPNDGDSNSTPDHNASNDSGTDSEIETSSSFAFNPEALHNSIFSFVISSPADPSSGTTHYISFDDTQRAILVNSAYIEQFDWYISDSDLILESVQVNSAYRLDMMSGSSLNSAGDLALYDPQHNFPLNYLFPYTLEKSELTDLSELPFTTTFLPEEIYEIIADTEIWLWYDRVAFEVGSGDDKLVFELNADGERVTLLGVTASTYGTGTITNTSNEILTMEYNFMFGNLLVAKETTSNISHYIYLTKKFVDSNTPIVANYSYMDPALDLEYLTGSTETNITFVDFSAPIEPIEEGEPADIEVSVPGEVQVEEEISASQGLPIP